MVQAYCTRCKKKVEAKDLEYVNTNSRNKMKSYRGICSECGCKVGVLSKTDLI